MPDSKLSAYTQLTGVGSLADADELEVVDKSDTTMAASGTNKRMVAGDLRTELLRIPVTAVPAAPAAGFVRLFAKAAGGGRSLPAYIGPSGLDSMLQPMVCRNRIQWACGGGGNTLTAMGVVLTATGTLTAPTYATTNLHQSLARAEYLVTVAATTAVAGFRGSAANVWRGNAAGLGGFYFSCRWGPATGVATASERAFVGLRAATGAPTDVQPSTLVSCLGMGWDSADAHVQFMSNDATGSCTKVDLGGSFAVPTADRTALYELVLFCKPNDTQVAWQVTDLNSGAVASGTVTAAADLPTNTTFMLPFGYVSAGGTSSVVGLSLINLYIESDT